MQQPLRAHEAKLLARKILDEGTVFISAHCKQRMAERDIDALDVTNVLRGGAYSEAEAEHGSWRHRAYTPKFEVVITFDRETLLVVVTAIRRRP